MHFVPLSFSRSLSNDRWYGIMRCAFLLKDRFLATSTPLSLSSLISSISAAGSTTTPFPIRHILPLLSIPEGIRWSMNFSSLITTVWPSLWPPWYLATTSAFSERKSTIFPLPSSPHCEPTTMIFGILRPRLESYLFDRKDIREPLYLLNNPGCSRSIYGDNRDCPAP